MIDRFSEDIDLAISHSFFGIDKTTRSQKEKLRKMARAYIHETLSKELDEQLNSRSTISFLPPESLLPQWRDDYNNMVQSFIYGDALDFDALMERMRELQRRVRGE